MFHYQTSKKPLHPQITSFILKNFNTHWQNILFSLLLVFDFVNLVVELTYSHAVPIYMR